MLHTDVELGWVLKDYLAMRYTQADPQYHQVLNSTWPWLEWLKRRTGEARLFVYKHAHTGNFVLAQWLYKPSETTEPVFKELEAFHGEPGSGMWPEGLLPADLLAIRLKGDSVSIAKKDAARAYQATQSRLEKIERRSDTADFLQKHGYEDGAHALRHGAIPFG